jgi:hypothetical protein
LKATNKTTHRHKEKGQSLLELAISLMLILTLLAGAVDFGLAFFSWVAIRDASQEGAIIGSVVPVDPSGNLNPEIEARIRDVSTTPVDMADASRVHINITLGSPPCPGQPITVEVVYDYQSITPVLSAFVGTNGITQVRATTTNTILTSTSGSCP